MVKLILQLVVGAVVGLLLAWMAVVSGSLLIANLAE